MFNIFRFSEEARILETVEAMKAMGFTDEGGWLTGLVRAHHGDIGLALDAVRAERGE